MQAIPATGMAHGIAYLTGVGKWDKGDSIVVCSRGDGSITEGEVSEAFQMAVLKRLPILYLVQDNNWGISATSEEMRAMDAYVYASGFSGIERMSVDGADFVDSYLGMRKAMEYVRTKRAPMLVHASCSLLGHHTSGVRKEWYRNDLNNHTLRDPCDLLSQYLLSIDVGNAELSAVQEAAMIQVREAYEAAVSSRDPEPGDLQTHIFAPTPVIEEMGIRTPDQGEKVSMVDAALHAVDELLATHPEALFYGQDVGRRLGGVFREAATLAEKYGDDRVFNTPIQEAYLIGSTAGMNAVGAKPIVEIQFGDYIWPGMNQLVEELSKSCYLSQGKFPIQALIRVPVGAYGGGGPYHSGSIESTLLTVRGIKVVYPSNAADMKGLLKASFYDPNPVVLLEHKGLYWSKVPGTGDAKTIEPDGDYVIPLGKARTVMSADSGRVAAGEACVIMTSGMGVHWARAASRKADGRVTIVDLRTLNPIDWDMIITLVRQHGRACVVTEEPLLNSFAESLAGRIQLECFAALDAPIYTVGSANLPAVPLNIELERAMLPSAEKVGVAIAELLAY
jgi:2-oxoisovalerate dehydrogenase E1 component